MSVSCRAVEEHDAGVSAKISQDTGEFLDGGFPFRSASLWVLFLHTDRAVKNDHGQFRSPAGGQAEPASGHGSADGKDQPGHGQHASQHDQDVPQPRHPASHPFGLQKKHRCRPRNGAVAILIDQMDQNRQRDQRQGYEDKRLEKCHVVKDSPRHRVHPGGVDFVPNWY